MIGLPSAARRRVVPAAEVASAAGDARPLGPLSREELEDALAAFATRAELASFGRFLQHEVVPRLDAPCSQCAALEARVAELERAHSGCRPRARACACWRGADAPPLPRTARHDGDGTVREDSAHAGPASTIGAPGEQPQPPPSTAGPLRLLWKRGRVRTADGAIVWDATTTGSAPTATAGGAPPLLWPAAADTRSPESQQPSDVDCPPAPLPQPTTVAAVSADDADAGSPDSAAPVDAVAAADSRYFAATVDAAAARGAAPRGPAVQRRLVRAASPSPRAPRPGAASTVAVTRGGLYEAVLAVFASRPPGAALALCLDGAPVLRLPCRGADRGDGASDADGADDDEAAADDGRVSAAAVARGCARRATAVGDDDDGARPSDGRAATASRPPRRAAAAAAAALTPPHPRGVVVGESTTRLLALPAGGVLTVVLEGATRLPPPQPSQHQQRAAASHTGGDDISDDVGDDDGDGVGDDGGGGGGGGDDDAAGAWEATFTVQGRVQAFLQLTKL